MREWITKRVAGLRQRLAGWSQRRAEKKQKRQWAQAVASFNLMIPQARLVVFASLLKDNHDLAQQFRRALGMNDAPHSQRPDREERTGRILTPRGFVR